MIDAARTDARGGFRAVDDPIRMIFQDLLVAHRLVVETGQIDFVGQFILDGAGPIVERRGSRPRGVFLVKETGEPLRHRSALGAALLGDLVADAPHDDAGMVAVAPGHIAHIALRPFVEILAVAVAIGDLRNLPHVERFVHHQQPHAVAEIE